MFRGCGLEAMILSVGFAEPIIKTIETQEKM
jgi:hypothetical protein